jgi:hypothetical protein
MIKFNYENHDDQAHDRRDGDQQIPADETQTSNISASDPGTTKKKRPVSERRVQANRRSALRSTGPRNTERTRFNATKRGFRAQGLTPWDDCEAYKESLQALKSIYASSNPLDLFLMEQTALEIVRIRRMARLEADNVVALSSPPDDSNDPGSEGGAPTVNFAMMKDYAVPVFDYSIATRLQVRTDYSAIGANSSAYRVTGLVQRTLSEISRRTTPSINIAMSSPACLFTKFYVSAFTKELEASRFTSPIGNC